LAVLVTESVVGVIAPVSAATNPPRVSVTTGHGYACRWIQSLGSAHRTGVIKVAIGGFNVVVPITTDPMGIYFDATSLVIEDAGNEPVSLPLTNTLSLVETTDHERTIGPAPLDGQVCLAELTPHSAPVVLVDQFWGGSAGINALEAFYQTTSGAWEDDSVALFGVATFEVLDGVPYLKTGNPTWELGSAAFGGEPLTLLTFANGRYVNVTRDHPNAVTRDASSEWRAFRSSQTQNFTSLGALAAWTGDLCELGMGSRALRTVRQLNASGKLKNKEGGGPSGNGFASEVQSLCHSQAAAQWPKSDSDQYGQPAT
jgi:hypothetical protein